MKLFVITMIALSAFAIPVAFADTPYIFVQIIHRDSDGNLISYLQSDKMTSVDLPSLDFLLDHESSIKQDPIYEIDGKKQECSFLIADQAGRYDKDEPIYYFGTPDADRRFSKIFAKILKIKYKENEVYFLPRHGRGHFISPTNINFRANIDALKQLGVTDIVSVSAVGSLKENLVPGTFVLVDQFIDRTFSRIKTNPKVFSQRIQFICSFER